jgi:hypothetical protein
MSVYGRIDIDYKRTGKATDLECGVREALVDARCGKSSRGK